MKLRTLALAALAACGTAAFAQSSVTLYGTVDQYINTMKSSSGASATALEDGAFLRTRLGMRGVEDLGNGLQAKFNLEMGINGDTGATAGNGFDRQSWVGLASPTWGEIRIGRQNTAIFYRGDYIDFTSRTLGSVVNDFGVPSRFDNDIAYLSPRIAGFMFEGHYALAETGAPSKQAIYQAAVDWTSGPYRLGYAGLYARAPSNALYDKPVRYDNLYANYDYGRGKVYAVFIRSNNSTGSASTSANGATILGNVGGLVAGTDPNVNRYFHIWQLSADYRATSQLRLGALYGRISDQSGGGANASGVGLAAYYDLSKRTTLYAVAQRLANDNAAGFRFAGSAGLKTNFSGGDVNGQSMRALSLGILHRF
jgi:predicted porin